jgi:predicted kinase
MDKNKLIMLIGFPRSGKTTWARKQGLPIVNPDSIRLAIHGHRFIELSEGLVWAIAKIMVYALFLAGHNKVILDACNVSEKRRSAWFSNNWDIEYQWINTNKKTCIERAQKENDLEIIPIIEKMWAEFDYQEPPMTCECNEY